jgi:hypothetical protein
MLLVVTLTDNSVFPLKKEEKNRFFASSMSSHSMLLVMIFENFQILRGLLCKGTIVPTFEND